MSAPRIKRVLQVKHQGSRLNGIMTLLKHALD